MKSHTRGIAAAIGMCVMASLAVPTAATAGSTGTGSTATGSGIRAISRPATVTPTAAHSTAASEGNGRLAHGTSATADLDATGIGERSIIDTDDRTKVLDTTVYPTRAIGQLVVGQNGSEYLCTGWLIDANTILTAGHCAYTPSPTGDDIIEYASFTPGRNGLTDPYGSCNATQAYAPEAWRVDGLPTNDWSLMHLDCSIGDTVGWFGIFWKKGLNALDGLNAKVQGYPAEKKFGTMWTMSGTIADATKLMVFYGIDTSGGQSGSPVFQTQNAACAGGPCAMAIHAYGVGLPGAGASNNAGPRITHARFTLILDLADDNNV